MARTLSDFAAMAGEPQFALVTLVAPAERDGALGARTLSRSARGRGSFRRRDRRRRNQRHERAGDDLDQRRRAAWKRIAGSRARGGKAGDALFVTGRLGGSIRGRHLDFIPRIEEARWLTANFSIHAMMDLSDGLGADLPRLAQASGVGFEIDEAGAAAPSRLHRRAGDQRRRRLRVALRAFA